MTLLARYLNREIASAVLFVLIAFLCLMGFFDFIAELADIGRGGYKLQHALMFVALNLPGHIYEIAPVAVLIGAVYALAQLASRSEFTAMRAAGLSRVTALKALAGLGVFFAVITLLVGEFLAPPAERLAQTVRLSALGASIAGQFRSGIWIKDSSKTGSGELDRVRFVNVSELLPDGGMKKIRIFELDSDLRLVEVIDAQSAKYQKSQEAWELSGVKARTYAEIGAGVGASTIRVRQFAESVRTWGSDISPDFLSAMMVIPERMSLYSLVQYVRHLKDNQQSAGRYEVALWSKLFYPVAVIVMLALALPSAYMQTRSGGVALKVFGGIMLGVGFHFLNALFSHLGALTSAPAWIAAATPSALAFVLACVMLALADRTRKLSDLLSAGTR
jgi:lipopolysaccharide export system permease protein